MNETDALEVLQLAIWTVMVCAGPAVAAAMAVGVAIAIVQALTQVQEVTLTFVPKIVVILIVSIFTAPLIGAELQSFTELVYSRVEKGFS
ncbi:MAG: flagellar biosynthetic protein FliQ [Hyphomicrobiales bacterium]